VDEIADLNAISRRKTLEPGQTYVFEGDRARDFANVTSGVAKLLRGSEDGRAQIVGLLFASDFICSSLGQTPLSDKGMTEPYSVEAVSQLELCIFERNAFEKLLTRYPTLERTLLDRTLNELQLARDWMVLLGRKTARERVATFLLHVADRMTKQGCNGTRSFELPLGRTDIADHIGLTVETVSRQITELRKDGILEMEGRRLVLSYDFERLSERAGF
jgi:CRP/FNR family transcriptional regulator